MFQRRVLDEGGAFVHETKDLPLVACQVGSGVDEAIKICKGNEAFDGEYLVSLFSIQSLVQ